MAARSAAAAASASLSKVFSRASASFDNDEIPESSASQAATSMLRGTPVSKKAKAMKQSKLVGHRVSKPMVNTSFHSAKGVNESPISPEKRRLISGVPGAEVERGVPIGGTEASPKKRKVDSSVGLGIGI